MKKEPINIVQKGDSVLRKVAQSVKLEEITDRKIQKVIKDMETALDSQDDGVAIAAPQIGIPLRIFVISRKVEALMKNKKISEEEISKLKYPIFINPEIKKISKTKARVDEGCLSVRYLYGKVERAEKATIIAYNENGEKFTKGGSGLLAQIFQHEVDHLNGILFIDKADNIVKILPQKENE